MLQWVQELALAQKMDVAAISTNENTDGDGRLLFRKHGFREAGDLQVPSDGDMKGFTYTYHVYGREEKLKEAASINEEPEAGPSDAGIR